MTNKSALRNKLDRIHRELALISDEMLWLDSSLLVDASVHVQGAINSVGLAIGSIPYGTTPKKVKTLDA